MENRSIKIDVRKIEWIEGIKGLAIIAVLLNHFVESYGRGAWFSNPSSEWPTYAVRMATLFPHDPNLFVRLIKFAGWLVDLAPGAFFLLSGLTLTMSALHKPLKPLDFYNKRLLRIYPLYISIHLIVFFSATLWFKWKIHFFSIKTALSLLGLRFTGDLFFYINPSWWFIWVIIQMYIFFPYLLILLQRKGVKLFLLITFSFTVLCRLFGIVELIHKKYLFIWMTGIFVGTRLFEFTAGMFIGYLLYNHNTILINFLHNKIRVFFISIGLGVIGFVLSWTYVGSLFSNIVMALVFTGLLYSIFELILKKIAPLKKALLWMGKASFSVFLLHQPFMMYASDKLTGMPKLIALIVIMILSFPAGTAIEKAVGKLTKLALEYKSRSNNNLTGQPAS